MSYEPLHHKYRPQRFSELVGQEAIATTLTHALDQQRIAPAYLFTGPRGTGKTSSARILAKSLNCLSSDAPTDNPCGTCDACRAIANGASLDVIEIDAASNTGVDNIRELIERAQFAPVQCRYKVYVIDECHMLSTAAFNALLKTLEEPPDRVVFVLATTDPQRVLPTIISRCQRFDFRRIPLDAMTQHLTAIAQKEDIAITKDAIYLVAQISQGGLRDAQSLLDQLSLWAGQVTVDKVWDLVGAVPERDLLNLLTAIAQDDGIAVLDCLRDMLNRGREPLIVLQNLAGMYRDLLIAKTAPQRNDLVALTADTWTALCGLAQQFEVSIILHGQGLLRTAEVQVKNTTQPRLWLEVNLLGLLPSAFAPTSLSSVPSISRPPSIPPTPATQPTQRPSPTPPSETVKTPTTLQPTEEIPRSEIKAQSQTTPPNEVSPPPTDVPLPSPTKATPSPTPESVQAELTEARLHRIWQEIVDHLHPLSKALLRDHGRLSSLSDRVAEIALSSQPLMKIAQSKVADIEQAFLDVLGTRIKVVLIVSAPSPDTSAPTESPTPLPKSSSQPSTNQPPLETPPKPSITKPERPSLNTDPTPSPSPPTAPSVTAESQEIPPTLSPDSPLSWQGEDDVTKAAKSLAQMFNGQVVNMDDDLDASSPDLDNLLSTSEAIADSSPNDIDSDDDDLPF